MKKNYIIVGCDLHEENMVLMIAANLQTAKRVAYKNKRARRNKMIEDLKRMSAAAGNVEVVFAYEASCLGYVLHDELMAAGFTCYVLAPSRMDRSPQGRSNKTDDRDAQFIFELLRAHVLAGNNLPAISVPDQAHRDAREITRARADAVRKLSKVKAQVTMLLKRNGVEKDLNTSSKWTKQWLSWLQNVCGKTLAEGARCALKSLLRQIEWLEQEVKELNSEVERLSEKEEFACEAEAMQTVKGVGPITSMTLLAELGDVKRFKKGKQVAAYMGLVPTSNESGQATDRKGHITRQGSAAGRRVSMLAQCAALPACRQRQTLGGMCKI